MDRGMFAGYTTYKKHRKKWICTYDNGHILSLSQCPMSTNWNEFSNSLVSSILRVSSAFVQRDVTITREISCFRWTKADDRIGHRLPNLYESIEHFKVSCNLSVAITWRNSKNVRICKGEKYAISWQNHEDHFFNKYRVPKVLCLSLTLTCRPPFVFFFAPFSLVFYWAAG